MSKGDRGMQQFITHNAILSTCPRRNLICAIKSKLLKLVGSSSGSSALSRCLIQISYHRSSNRLKYVSAPGNSRRCLMRCRTELRGTAGKTCSSAPQSSRLASRVRARITADASRANSSYSFVQWNRCLRRPDLSPIAASINEPFYSFTLD